MTFSVGIDRKPMQSVVRTHLTSLVNFRYAPKLMKTIIHKWIHLAMNPSILQQRHLEMTGTVFEHINDLIIGSFRTIRVAQFCLMCQCARAKSFPRCKKTPDKTLPCFKDCKSRLLVARLLIPQQERSTCSIVRSNKSSCINCSESRPESSQKQ